MRLGPFQAKVTTPRVAGLSAVAMAGFLAIALLLGPPAVVVLTGIMAAA